LTRTKTNAMWTMNQKIFDESKGNIIIAHCPNFEEEYFDELASSDKPFKAISKLNDEIYKQTQGYQKLVKIFELLEDNQHPNIIANINDYKKLICNYKKEKSIGNNKLWEI